MLTAATTSEDIEDWDSLTHIQLVVAIEKKFKIKFTTAEVVSYNNVGEMCQAVMQKMNNLYLHCKNCKKKTKHGLLWHIETEFKTPNFSIVCMTCRTEFEGSI